MKTIEEKAKAYDEILEKAQEIKRKILQSHLSTESCKAVSEYIDTIIPELADSEDERIRKWIVAEIKHQYLVDGKKIYCEEAKDALAYLERQKEQKPTAEEVLVKAGLKPYKDGNQWCILAGDNIQEGICGFGDTIDEALYQFLMEVLEKQKEQKPNKDTGFSSVTKFVYSKSDEEFIRDCANILKGNDYGVSAERLLSMLDQKPISDMDIVPYIDDQIAALQDMWREQKVAFDWDDMKEMIEGVAKHFYHQEQKPVEWSEEDERMITTLISYINKETTRVYRPEWINFLKSLRPSWKPSTEQIGMVTRVCNGLHMQNSSEAEGMDALLKQLEKIYWNTPDKEE